ncbi:MAG: alpha/beta fold hydrolase [Dehalococcoidia bacterium]|nr:alpha/beta fold hydrolase [Dehalococcoidia bacterium]
MIQLDPGKYVEARSGDSSLRVHYHEMGPPDGAPIVFVQTGGAATSAWMCWHPTLPAFAAAGYHVYAPDAVGQGETSLVSGERVAGPDFLIAFMDAAGLSRAHFIGNSGGTMSITPLAGQHPERVLSFIASGGEPRASTPESAAIAPRLGRTARMDHVRAMLSQPEISLDDMRRATAAFFCDPRHPAIDDVAELRLALVRKPGQQEKERDAAFAQLQGGRQLLDDDVFRRIQAPTFLLHGRDEPGFYDEADVPALLAAALRPMHLIPHCDAAVLANCGHWPQLEMPERYNALCLEFLHSV